ESRQIVSKLAGGKDPAIAAHADPRCLACHTTPRPAKVLKVTAWMNPDGIGCEACHGPAEKWLGPHTTCSWSGLDPETKEKRFGFVPTQLLARRAGVCVPCHVGVHPADDAPLQDVNHDLIAAGHPRLNFEFSAYQDRMPAHWVEKGRNAAAD